MRASWWWGLGLVALLASAGARAQVDLTPFVRRDSYGQIKISPDGGHLAATVPLEDRTVLVVLRRADKQIVAGGMGVENSAVWDFWWVDDEHIVISMAQSFGSKDPLYATGELHVLGLGDKRIKRLFGYEDDVGLVDRYGGAPDSVELATVIDPMLEAPGSVMIATWVPGTTPKTQVETLGVASGRRNVVVSAPIRRADFTLDPAGGVRFADGLDERNYRKLYYRENAKADWRLVNDSSQSGFIARALGMAADGATAYVQVTQEQGPDTIEAWDMRTLARKVALRDPVVDPDAILYDVDGRTPVGARYVDDGVRMRFFDETAPMARRYRMLEKAFPGSGAEITSSTRDGTQSLVRIWNDRVPGEYFLFDSSARTADGVFVQMEWFAPDAMAATRKVELQARDGVPLHGYLTLPRDGGETGLPLVVMPHGGPYGIHDDWGFDLEAQLLAAAGYAVLRLNYRGSGHYGRAFRDLGAQEWGGTMQDDLTDATRWTIDRGIADPRRICLFGASYGGYAALMGAAREPGLYRCVAGYVGVYDLVAMHADRARTAAWMRNWANDWMGVRGSLAQKSPVNLAGQIKAPVFLAAGGADDIAPIEHTKKMERALKKAGVPVQTLYVDSEGHGFRKEANRRAFYGQLLDFLAEHLGGRPSR